MASQAVFEVTKVQPFSTNGISDATLAGEGSERIPVLDISIDG